MKYSRQLVTGLAPYEIEFMLKKLDESKKFERRCVRIRYT
ncbi:hypothetical protein BG20_I0148 [Candidatus Nitrosarchaeum limnium BG20]|uniref:Uncharacterized protein n=1 Tax=Candidatus Nitrosarchaeum limnium BG20 TaxID=859192 RepID=S2E1X3_9ARCH|nr:hypothetical protein BG20_I0148 [Candidatus Nitrosarchaeum limnium BG20]